MVVRPTFVNPRVQHDLSSYCSSTEVFVIWPVDKTNLGQPSTAMQSSSLPALPNLPEEISLDQFLLHFTMFYYVLVLVRYCTLAKVTEHLALPVPPQPLPLTPDPFHHTCTTCSMQCLV